MPNIKSVLTLPTKIWGVISFAGTVLLLGEPLLKRYSGGSELFLKYGVWIAVITLLAYSFLLIELILYFWRVRRLKQERLSAIAYLNNLTSDKKMIISNLYLSPTHVLKLKYNVEQVRELEENLVIGRTTNTQIVYGDDFSNIQWDYMLQPWVVNLIDEKKITLNS